MNGLEAFAGTDEIMRAMREQILAGASTLDAFNRFATKPFVEDKVELLEVHVCDENMREILVAAPLVRPVVVRVGEAQLEHALELRLEERDGVRFSLAPGIRPGRFVRRGFVTYERVPQYVAKVGGFNTSESLLLGGWAIRIER